MLIRHLLPNLIGISKLQYFSSIESLPREPSVKGRVFVLCAPFPFSKADTPSESAAFLRFLRAERPALAVLYEKLGWTLPADVGRVYDSSLAVELLEWRPRVTFDRLMAALAAAAGGPEGAAGAVGIDPDDAREGRY